jgi:Protein of unknown function (DUF2742)
MSPPRESRPGGNATETANGSAERTTQIISDRAYEVVASQQVSWWPIHLYVQPFLDAAGSWPMAGTPAWCELADNDAAKLAALLDAARHHVLRVETAQAALCEASRDVAAAEDWSAVANEIRQRREVYIPRRVAL